MNALLSQACILLAVSALAGCAVMSAREPSAALSDVSAPEAARGPSESRLQWHEDAQELRTFADRHEVEAEMLLQHSLPTDARLIQQRRALAQQLRVAADQIEQRAQEMP
ncbi:MAG: exported protein of unknown function [Nitrospira sp.]|nr:hypothetical protein [Nitrospira sp.]ULA60099.1 MAG: exported protein of unknown function [Nitrospira sp.]